MSDTSEGPGQVLRAEREALDVTTRDVAETLNLSVTMVEAIEADDYEQMPVAVFARGYIRAYARLLSLEPEPIVARYPENLGVASGDGTSRRVSVAEQLRRFPRLVIGAVALILLLLVLLTIWVWPDAEPDAESAPRAGAVPGPEIAEARESAVGAVANTDAQGLAGGDPEIVAPPPVGMTVSAPDAGPLDSAEADADMPAAGSAASVEQESLAAEPVADSGTRPPEYRRITEFGDDRLRFDFSDDCWVEVKSATGRRLYGDLSQADATLSLIGAGPFRILLGYAPGVRMSFNGEQISLAPHTRNNVATLVVGQ